VDVVYVVESILTCSPVSLFDLLVFRFEGRRYNQSYNVLFKQVTGIKSPVLHGLTSAAGSANAVLRDWKKATNATTAGGVRIMAIVFMNAEIWQMILLSHCFSG